MNLLQEYKELYYKEMEFNDRLDSKITTCITFLTILGSALILLWTQIKHFKLTWYTGVYLAFCIIVTVMFVVCIGMFFRTYTGYKIRYFSIKTNAIQNTKTLNSVAPEQKDNAYNIIEQSMAERFINDAIHNRELNTIKNNRHRKLIIMIMATFIVTFITYSINIAIDYYETNYVDKNIQEIYINGGELNAK